MIFFKLILQNYIKNKWQIFFSLFAEYKQKFWQLIGNVYWVMSLFMLKIKYIYSFLCTYIDLQIIISDLDFIKTKVMCFLKVKLTVLCKVLLKTQNKQFIKFWLKCLCCQSVSCYISTLIFTNFLRLFKSHNTYKINMVIK